MAGKALRADPPPDRRRVRLDSVGRCRRELARLYVETRRGALTPQDASRLATILGLIARLLQGPELEARIAALEAALGPGGEDPPRCGPAAMRSDALARRLATLEAAVAARQAERRREEMPDVTRLTDAELDALIVRLLHDRPPDPSRPKLEEMTDAKLDALLMSRLVRRSP